MKEIEVDLPEYLHVLLEKQAQKEGITLEELCSRLLRKSARNSVLGELEDTA